MHRDSIGGGKAHVPRTHTVYMLDGTPRTLLKGARTVFDEGEMLTQRTQTQTHTHMHTSAPPTDARDAVKGFIKMSEPPVPRQHLSSAEDRKNLTHSSSSSSPNTVTRVPPRNAYAKPRDSMFFSNLINSILIIVNLGLMAAVAFLFYLAYPLLVT